MRRSEQLLPENKTLHMWIYGPPGVGKTKAALQAARLGRTLFIAVESGIMQHHLDKVPMENLCIVGPDDMNDLNIVYNKLAEFQTTYYKWAENQTDALRENLRRLDSWFQNKELDPVAYKPRPFVFIIVDTLTDVQKDTIIHQAPRDAKDFTKSKTLQIQEWGKSNAMLDSITDAMVKQEKPYVDLRCNSIWISHERTEYNEDGAIARVCPALSGQNPKLIGAKFDVEAYCKLEFKGGARIQSMIVQKHGLYSKYDVKDRTDKLGNEIADSAPGACDIVERIMKNCGWIPKGPDLALEAKNSSPSAVKK